MTYKLVVDEPFGQVVSISGMNITVRIRDKVLKDGLQILDVKDDEGKLKNFFVGSVGDIFVVGDDSTNGRIHFAIFEEIRLATTFDPRDQTQDAQDLSLFPNPEEDGNSAVARAKVIGYQDYRSPKALKFRRGIGHYPKFDAKCFVLTPKEKQSLFSIEDESGLVVGKIPGLETENVSINIHKFLGKHTVILGSTGSGKSCTVASILQKTLQKHLFSHVVFFDLHNEYGAAFTSNENSTTQYKVNHIDGGDFVLPYWFLTLEEFQHVFLGDLDSGEKGVAIRVLKQEILGLKEKAHEDIESEVGSIHQININAPLYFSFDELLNSIRRINTKTIWGNDQSEAWDSLNNRYLPNTGASKTERKMPDGTVVKTNVKQDTTVYGKLFDLIEKLELRKSDRRYKFLFPERFDQSLSLYGFIEGLLSINNGTNDSQMTIFDLSRIPSETIPSLIGILSRMSFEYKLWEESAHTLPILLVFEEAHNYIPKKVREGTQLPTKYIGRIAKEGRKYGISQIIISQRPSDLSEVIVSQCSNFIVLRVTNPNDQAFIGNVLPDHLSALTSMIPFFQNGESLLAGEMVTIPTKALIDMPDPEPNSNDVMFSQAWKRPMKDYNVKETIHRWWEIQKKEEE